MIHLGHAVGRGGMPLGKTGDTDAEAAWVRVQAAFVEALDAAHEFGGMGKGTGVCLARRQVAAQSQDVADSGGGIAREQGHDFRLAVAHTGEMRDGIKDIALCQLCHEALRQLTRAAASAVGHAGKGGTQGSELIERALQRLHRRRRARREELEGERGGAAGG